MSMDRKVKVMQVKYLHEVKGLSYEEIGDRLGITSHSELMELAELGRKEGKRKKR